MFKIFTAALLGLCLSVPVFAAESTGTNKENPQTNKMRTCAQEYHQRSIPKNEYRKFMSFCLRKDYVLGSYAPGTTSMPTPTAQKETAAAPQPAETQQTTTAQTEPELNGRDKQKNKMKTCNGEAKEQKLKGAERKEFMKACLSAD